MLAIATTVISLLTEILPLVGSATVGAASVSTAINTLTQLIPVAVQEGEALITPIKNIIAQISSTGAPTADELASLAALDAQCDAAFEAAATAAGDPAPAS